MSNLDISLSRSHFHGSSPNVWPASPFCWPSPSSPSLEALGGCAQQTKMTTVFFSSKMIRESVNVFCVLFVYWWNMLQACRSQSRSELTSCVCSLARELSPFKKGVYGKTFMRLSCFSWPQEFRLFPALAQIRWGFQRTCSVRVPSEVSSEGILHPPWEATDVLTGPPSPHEVALVNNARDL